MSDQTAAADLYRTLLEKLIGEVTSTSKVVLMRGLTEIVDDPGVQARLSDNRLVPYIYVVGFLSFCARDVTRESISSTLNAMGVNPDPSLLDIIMGAKPKSHLVYLYCAYTLVAMGKGADQAKVMAFAKAFGITPDQEAAREALEIFEDKYKPK